ncbi:MAG: hypothetical protein LBF08_01575 [Dysgonamonadaceae bacterium]|jgi:hypothetical protein|nr:hypothetical protein [Dysgonamonadaceae bacterium]
MKTIFFSRAKALATALLSLIFIVDVSAHHNPHRITSDDNYEFSDRNNIIIVEEGVSAHITMTNVEISDTVYITGGEPNISALSIKSGATVRLTLKGNNTLIGLDGGAGIEVCPNATLIIDGSGTLTVQGGKNGGAGIGGANRNSAGSITIESGRITAIGGGQSAAIGGGNGGSASNIRIDGGTITAIGGLNSVAIGGGYAGNGGNLIVNGGTINATRGIGPESGNFKDIGAGRGGTACTFTINGGSVKGEIDALQPKNKQGELVYPVRFTYASDALSDVTITEFNVDRNIFAYGVTDVKFDNGNLYFWLPQRSCSQGQINMTLAAYVNIGEQLIKSFSNVDFFNANSSSGLVVQLEPLPGELTISRDGIVINRRGDYEFSGVMQYPIVVAPEISASIVLNAVNIVLETSGFTNSQSAIELKDNSSVNLILKGENILVGGGGGYGITVPEHATLIINGDGQLASTVIGGARGSGGTITITGGSVYADIGENVNFTITGGTVVSSVGDNTNFTITGGNVRTDVGENVNFTITGGNVIPGRFGSTPTDNQGNPVYMLTTQFSPSIKANSLVGDFQCFFNLKSYGFKDVRTDNNGKIYLWLPMLPISEIYGEENIVLKKDGENVYANVNRFDFANSREITLHRCIQVNFELKNAANAEIYATNQRTYKMITSGSRSLPTDLILVNVIPSAGNSRHLYRWDHYVSGSSEVNYYSTEEPEKTFSLNNASDYIYIGCEVEPQYTIKYKLEIEGANENEYKLRGKLTGKEAPKSQEGTNDSVYAINGDVFELALVGKNDVTDTKYAHSLIVNGKLIGIDVNPIPFDTIINASIDSIDVRYVMKPMKQLRFGIGNLPNGTTASNFDIVAEYSGNTFYSVSHNYLSVGTYRVENNALIVPGGKLSLTVTPKDEKTYQYIWTLGTNIIDSTFNKEFIQENVSLDNILSDSNPLKMNVAGPWSVVSFSMVNAPVGTESSAFFGETEIQGEKKFVPEEEPQTLKLKLTLPAGSPEYDYRWSGFGENHPDTISKTPELELPNFVLDGKLDIKCEVLTKCKINYAFEEEIPGLKLIAFYDDETPVENGDSVWSGKSFYIRVDGKTEDVALYNYTWSGIEVWSETQREIWMIDTVRNHINITCTATRRQSASVLAALTVQINDLADGHLIDVIEIFGDTAFILERSIPEINIVAYPYKDIAVHVSGDGLHTLNDGTNIFTVVVQSEDFLDETTYRITIERPEICGDSLYWSMKDDTLTIFGSGRMTSYGQGYFPWSAYAGEITTIILKEGVSHISDGAFLNFDTLSAVINYNGKPQNVQGINKSVFDTDVFGIWLWVPKDRTNVYGSAPVWKEFSIRELDGGSSEPPSVEPPATGILSSDASPVRIYSGAQTLYIDTPNEERIDIYSLTGKLLYSVRKPAGVSNYRVEKAQAVIVRGSAGWVEKVIVR